MKNSSKKISMQHICWLQVLYIFIVAISISVYYGEIESNVGLLTWGYLFWRRILPTYLQGFLGWYEEFLAFIATLGVLLIGFYLPWRRNIIMLFVAIMGLLLYMPIYGTLVNNTFLLDYFESIENAKTFLWMHGQGLLGLVVVPPSACTFAFWLWKFYENKDHTSISIVFRIIGVYLLGFGGAYFLLLFFSPSAEIATKFICNSWTIKAAFITGILSLFLSLIWKSQKQKPTDL